MQHPNFLRSIDEETRIRIDGRERPDPHATALWNMAIGGINRPEDRRALTAAREFSRHIDYRHDGLSSEIYAAHPLRVAAMVILSQDEPDVHAGVIALLHNVYEVSDIAADEISEQFGEKVSAGIATLTVDRVRQWQPEYKTAYYAAIRDGGPSISRVKVFDKLDNLFLIGINPDQSIRKRYMDEIEQSVLPLAADCDPAVFQYMEQLLGKLRDEEQTRNH